MCAHAVACAAVACTEVLLLLLPLAVWFVVKPKGMSHTALSSFACISIPQGQL
jgi:hypothetical protein